MNIPNKTEAVTEYLEEDIILDTPESVSRYITKHYSDQLNPYTGEPTEAQGLDDKRKAILKEIKQLKEQA